MAIWISIDFLFAVFTFMKKFQQNLLPHVRLFRLSAVLIKQLVEYLLKQARSIWLQGNCRGPYRLSFLLYPSRNSQRKTHFPKNWTWWFERRTAAWITKICIIQSMLNVLEKDIFLPKLTSYFYHLIFSSYLINEIGKPKFFVYFLSAPLFDMCEVNSGNNNIHCWYFLPHHFVGHLFLDKSRILLMFSRHLLEPTGLVCHLLLNKVELWWEWLMHINRYMYSLERW